MAAPTTDVEIAQLALGDLGTTVALSATAITAPATKEEREVSRWFEHTRRTLLARAPWAFSNTREDLTEIDPDDWAIATTYGASTGGSSNVVLYDLDIYVSLQAANTGHQPDESPTWWKKLTRDEWEFIYDLPSDYLVAEYIYPRRPRIPYELGKYPTGGTVLFTNEDEAVLQYRSLVTDVDSYPSLFVDAFHWTLAENLFVPLKVSIKERPRIQMAAKIARGEALSVLLKEKEQDDDDDSNDSAFLRVRG